MANSTGNGTKSLVTSVNASLKNLQTDYIDLVRPSPCSPKRPSRVLTTTYTALCPLVGLHDLHT